MSARLNQNRIRWKSSILRWIYDARWNYPQSLSYTFFYPQESNNFSLVFPLQQLTKNQVKTHKITWNTETEASFYEVKETIGIRLMKSCEKSHRVVFQLVYRPQRSQNANRFATRRRHHRILWRNCLFSSASSNQTWYWSKAMARLYRLPPPQSSHCSWILASS